ncbi:MAG: LLM class flavin-dependent oxidoreductase, partial [Chloroflexota bacterium]|nr:LLM class flavin-dependent oxidoreductase [Chloroflexota bacterium]
MRFGAFLPTHWGEYGARYGPVALERVAQAAQELGYRSVWVNDHVVAPASQGSLGQIVEPLITLGSLIHLVPDLDLGVSVLVLPQRNA